MPTWSLRLIPLLVLLHAGCYESHVRGGDRPDGAPPPPPPPPGDAGPRIDGGGRTVFSLRPSIDQVDLLFVIDNSNSMHEHQTNLARELPRMVEGLTTGLSEGVGAFDPVRSIQIGIVTTDMGTAGFVVPTCDPPMFGDDGILQTRGRTAIDGCAATYPPVLAYRPASDDQTPEEFASDVTCVALLGTGGCGFEQQLEAPLKALSPSAPQPWTATGYRPPTFFANAVGHGDGANAGFVREGSVLAVVLVTDEEDCSFVDPEIANPDPGSTFGRTNLNLRCAFHPEALHPADRFVRGLLGLRRRPEQLVFLPIVGVPQDLASPPDGATDYARILADPRMVQEEDPARPNRLRPSCETPGVGSADPPRRIVEVARGLEESGAQVSVQSICDASLDRAVDALLDRVAAGLGHACLDSAPPRRPEGGIDCELVIIAPSATSCDAFRGARPRLRADGTPDRFEGRALCDADQLVPSPLEQERGDPPAGDGWFFDAYTSVARERCPLTGFRIALTEEAPPGTDLQLLCRR